MNICILGWYGTETIGDRAILAGIISLLSEKFKGFDVNLGSLYPFYSERMIKEDKELYRLLIGKDINLKLFDSKHKKSLEKNIKCSDVLIIGGGPLMDLPELYMLKYAFRYAKRYNKKKFIYGCGVGPLFKDEYQKIVIDIAKLSDGIILRDTVSKKNLLNYAKKFNEEINNKKIYTSFDPAVECAFKYKMYLSKLKQDKNIDILINLREFPSEYSNSLISENVNIVLLRFLENLSKEKRNVRLIPMHYFSIGSDDRKFLSKLVFNITNNKIYEVQNRPLSLIETMQYFYNAQLNFGMRFHSVVLQTILNGNNIVLDYTEPTKGKIGGFLKDIDFENFYTNRYFCLQKGDNVNINLNEFDNKLSSQSIKKYYEQGKNKYNEFNQII